MYAGRDPRSLNPGLSAHVRPTRSANACHSCTWPDSASCGPRPLRRLSEAINRTLEAIARDQKRLLLVMATGTGKTYTTFQIIWRLWKPKRTSSYSLAPRQAKPGFMTLFVCRLKLQNERGFWYLELAGTISL